MTRLRDSTIQDLLFIGLVVYLVIAANWERYRERIYVGSKTALLTYVLLVFSECFVILDYFYSY